MERRGEGGEERRGTKAAAGANRPEQRRRPCTWPMADAPSLFLLLAPLLGAPLLLPHAAAEAEDEVEGRLLLDVVIREGAAVLELLPREDQPLLVGRDALLVLDLGLDVLDRVRRLDLERDGLAGQRLNEDL